MLTDNYVQNFLVLGKTNDAVTIVPTIIKASRMNQLIIDQIPPTTQLTTSQITLSSPKNRLTGMLATKIKMSAMETGPSWIRLTILSGIFINVTYT